MSCLKSSKGKMILCWLLIACLLFACAGAALASSTGKTKSQVVLRKSASKEAKALQSIPKGEEVTILSTSGDWYKVRYGNYTGYVMQKYIKTASSSEKSAQIKALGSAPGIMRVGDENSDVKKLQQALQILGYYNGKIDGKYGSGTTAAVKQYQKDKGLTADGYAGTQTVKSIFGSCSSKSLTTQASPTTTAKATATAKATYKTEVKDWFKDNVAKLIPKKAHYTIKDVKTGKTFEGVHLFGSNHMDTEPRTKKDTATLKSIYGGSWSWKRRAILVKYNGHVYAASMNGMPHGTSTIDNDFDGHFCIHFKNSRTHESNKVDSDHQNCVTQASKATW